jgi:hypothetical protein
MKERFAQPLSLEAIAAVVADFAADVTRKDSVASRFFPDHQYDNQDSALMQAGVLVARNNRERLTRDQRETLHIGLWAINLDPYKSEYQREAMDLLSLLDKAPELDADNENSSALGGFELREMFDPSSDKNILRGFLDKRSRENYQKFIDEISRKIIGQNDLLKSFSLSSGDRTATSYIAADERKKRTEAQINGWGTQAAVFRVRFKDALSWSELSVQQVIPQVHENNRHRSGDSEMQGYVRYDQHPDMVASPIPN